MMTKRSVGKQNLMLLPVPSTTLCFDKNVFMKVGSKGCLSPET